MHELIVKKSRFIACAATVDSEEAAKSYIAEISHQHKKARQVVFAYVTPTAIRHSDAGELSGTAGPLLLNSIHTTAQYGEHSGCSCAMLWRDFVGQRRADSRLPGKLIIKNRD